MGFGIILLVRMVVVVVGIHIGVNYVVFFVFFGLFVCWYLFHDVLGVELSCCV